MLTMDTPQQLKPGTDRVLNVKRESSWFAVTFENSGGLWVGMYLPDGRLDWTMWNGTVEDIYRQVDPSVLASMVLAV